MRTLRQGLAAVGAALLFAGFGPATDAAEPAGSTAAPRWSAVPGPAAPETTAAAHARLGAALLPPFLPYEVSGLSTVPRLTLPSRAPAVGWAEAPRPTDREGWVLKPRSTLPAEDPRTEAAAAPLIVPTNFETAAAVEPLMVDPFAPGGEAAPVPLGPLEVVPPRADFEPEVPPAPGEELVPEPVPLDLPPSPWADPVFGQVLGEVVPVDCPECKECQPWYRLLNPFAYPNHRKSGDIGIGEERVIYAPFVVEPAQPQSNWRFRYETIGGIKFPDRAEYWWPAAGRGPLIPEPWLDLQELRLYQETAIDSNFSLFSEYPIRMIDPLLNGNTAGFGDMNIGNKAVLLRGEYWLITQYFRATFPTAAAKRGLGNGHTTLEPGILWRYMYTPETYIHGDVRYWIPAGGDPLFAGDMLRWGFALSTVLYETDTFAILPTAELVGYSFFRGMKTAAIVIDPTTVPVPLAIPVPLDVDGETFITLEPGVRFVLGPQGDLGLFELGFNASLSTDPDAWYDDAFRMDLRWSY